MNNHFIHKMLLLAMLSLGPACGGPSGATSDAGHDAPPSVPDVIPFAGLFTGKAHVAGVQFLKIGEFPAKVALYQGGNHVRGFLDVEQTPADTGVVDSPSYYVDGTVDGVTVRSN